MMAHSGATRFMALLLCVCILFCPVCMILAEETPAATEESNLSTASLLPEDEFVSCVIFDSDEPNGKNADVSPGQEARPDALCQLMGIKDADDREIAKKYIFLFPDGKKDGDLEVILRNAVSDTPEHLKYFSGP